MPDRMIFGQKSKLIRVVGEHLVDQLAEAPVEIGAAAAGFGEDEPAAPDVLSQILPFGAA